MLRAVICPASPASPVFITIELRPMKQPAGGVETPAVFAEDREESLQAWFR